MASAGTFGTDGLISKAFGIRAECLAPKRRVNPVRDPAGRQCQVGSPVIVSKMPRNRLVYCPCQTIRNLNPRMLAAREIIAVFARARHGAEEFRNILDASTPAEPRRC